MPTFKTSAADLSERMDVNYYHPRYVRNARVLSAFPSTRFDGIYRRFGIGHTASVEQHYDSSGNGIPFVSGRAIGQMELHVNKAARVLRQSHYGVMKKSILASRDLLLVRKGAVGNCCVIPPLVPEINCSSEVMFFCINDANDPHFLCAFFATPYGRLTVERLQRGSIIPGVSLLDVPSMRVFHPHFKAQTYVGDKVRQAERLSEQARRLEIKIDDHFRSLTSNVTLPRKAWRIGPAVVGAYRLNAGHYDAVVLNMLENAAKIGSLVSLGSIIGDHGIKGGATPLGADYASEGVFFVRVQNVKPYRLDLSDAAYVDGEADEMLKRSRCVAGDIILGITGYPGTASLVMEDDLPVNINQHSVRFNTDGSLTPEYVTAAINSTFVQKQVDRLAIGGTRDALDYPSVRDLQIPVLDDAIAAEVTTSVNVANAAVRASSRLTTTAKCLVEALIEGKVSETDLVQAQEALERHDHGPDRALLARLTSRGMDVPDAAPLFPDLDKLYELLDQTDGDNPNGAAQGT